MFWRKALQAGFLAACVMAVVPLASANRVVSEFGPNLVTNGSFEATTNTTTPGFGWTISGFIAEGFDYFVDTVPADAQSGTHSFAGGAVGDLGFISQNITTIPGQNYNIHLWLANLSGFTDGTAIEVLWGGSVVYSATDILGFGYNQIVIDPKATSATTTLSIGLRDDAFFLNVDNISVRAAPEPATLALFLGGLGVAALSRRRRSAD